MKSSRVRASGSLRALFVVLPVLLITGSLYVWSCTDQPGRGGGGLVLAAEANSDADFGLVSEFSLTERSGAAVTNATLAGQPYIASFFFARCAGPCPALLGQVRRLQEELGPESDVRLVSITVDPKHDTPEVLTDHANSYTADPEQWLFLTGEEDAIFGLMRNSFHLALDRLPDKDSVMGMQITHDTRLVVVDGDGRVRGYYDGTVAEEIDLARERAEFLAGQ